MEQVKSVLRWTFGFIAVVLVGTLRLVAFTLQLLCHCFLFFLVGFAAGRK